ncbi:MAG: type II secretion system F family protein [Sulfitobacter sp.]
MNNITDPISDAALASPELMLMYFAGFAILLLASGSVGLFMARDRTAQRLRSVSAAMNGETMGLTKQQENVPSGWKKALIPEDPSERAQIRFQLGKVGFDGPRVVEYFFLIRLALALMTPAIIYGGLGLAKAGWLPADLAQSFLDSSAMVMMQISAIGAGIGFYLPGYWLSSRIKARQTVIRKAFPNALDLVQISVEAGMGFDAAINRVGQELSKVAPEVAYEFLLLQLEIQAGRDREASLFDMADRMGIDEAKSFALVIVQSLQFGTSLTTALKTYANEMRQMRELSAQEKANRLPVQMSAVMSFMMLPALFLITLTPVVIRYMAVF